MLEKPDLPEDLILLHLRDEFGLQAVQATFLPLGVDTNTAVYRILTSDEQAYFLKLRKGKFDEIMVLLPEFLKSQGIPAIIAPLKTQSQESWGRLNEYKMVLYPFVQGQDGYERALAERQWINFGEGLKAIHTVQVPADLLEHIPRETFYPKWREMVREYQSRVERIAYEDPVAAKFAAYMQARRDEISHMVSRAEQLGLELKSRSPEFVLCHSDIHPGNLLIPENGANGKGEVYIIDWDEPSLAPKEHDLMHIGGNPFWKEAGIQALFYRGYGPAKVDQIALAYYRYERIIQDIAAFGEQVLETDGGGEDREQAFLYFKSNFLPGCECELARKADPLWSN
jgi:spectinomycin phosphotransferase